MIANLPQKFPLNMLSEFTFGDVEAQNDYLLENPICICKIDPVLKFLNENKSLIVGERGAGKSALFRLIKDNILHFKKSNPADRHVIISIQEDLEYKAIKEQLVNKIQTEIKDEAFKYRIVWEIYILYRVIQKVKDEFSSIPNHIQTLIRNFEEIFTGEKVPIIQLLLKQKITTGVKLDVSSSGAFLYPHFYGSLEPSGKTTDAQEIKRLIDIDAYKKKLQKFLESSNTVFFVLIDKLDEFMIKESYDIQKLTLQGLLMCDRSYLEMKNLKLKIFLRNDLFARLDFEELGYDKVQSRKIDLIWGNADILSLIARRIAYNYSRILGIGYLDFLIGEAKLYQDGKDEGKENTSRSLDMYKRLFLEDSENDIAIKESSPFEKIINWVLRSRRVNRDERVARRISFTEEIDRQIICSIFPQRIKHRTQGGKKVDVDFFEFLETHFSLNLGTTTPRIMIMFLEKCLDRTKAYYKANPDESVVVDKNYEYPLISFCCGKPFFN